MSREHDGDVKLLWQAVKPVDIALARLTVQVCSLL
jgi:hypothetical protein